MISSQLLNAVGLVSGMIGVVIIFLYGPPQPNLETGVTRTVEDGTLLPDGRTAAEHDADTRRLKARFAFMSKAGLALVFIGFAFQLWATVCPT